MPRLYDLTWEKPPPLVERRLRLEVDERIDAQGEVQSAARPTPTSSGALDALLGRGHRGARGLPAQRLRQPRPRGARSRRLRASAALPGLPLCCQQRGAAGDPRVRADLHHRHQRLRAAGRAPLPARAAGGLDGDRACAAPLLIMQSNGGLMTAEAAADAGRAHHRVRPGGRRRSAPRRWRRAIGRRQAHHLRHGRHDRQGLARRGRRGRAATTEYEVGGGIMHGQPAAERRRLRAARARHRPRRGRRGRRQHRLARPGRRAAGRPAQRRRLARPALLRPRRHRAHRHRRQRRPGLPQPGRTGRRRRAS